MSSRKEQKARARQEREAKEQQRRAEERRRQLRTAGAAALVAILLAGLLIVQPWDRGTTAAFSYSSDGVAKRVAAAGLKPGDGPHIHPKLNVVIRDKPIAVPANMGIGAAHQPMHTHETDGTIHVEGAAERATIGQFMALWGVTFGRDRLGPYRSNGSERVRMWVKMPRGKLFRETRPNAAAKLTDGEEIYLFFGASSQAPIA